MVTDVPLEYPFPFTVTAVPTDPVEGLTDADGTTVNVAMAVLELASVACTVCVPTADGGTANVVVNDPVLSVVAVAT